MIRIDQEIPDVLSKMQAAIQGTVSPLSALEKITDWATVKKVSPQFASKRKLLHPDIHIVPQAQRRAGRAGICQGCYTRACRSRRDCHKFGCNEKCYGLICLSLAQSALVHSDPPYLHHALVRRQVSCGPGLHGKTAVLIISRKTTG